jgi:hypothetical protein
LNILFFRFLYLNKWGKIFIFNNFGLIKNIWFKENALIIIIINKNIIDKINAWDKINEFYNIDIIEKERNDIKSDINLSKVKFKKNI